MANLGPASSATPSGPIESGETRTATAIEAFDGVIRNFVSTDASTFQASRITNKFVYDFAGNKYRYKLAAATATFVSVAYA